MNRKLAITIDAEDETCGECGAFCCGGEKNWCDVFGASPAPGGLRLPECLAAEREARPVRVDAAEFLAHLNAGGADEENGDG